MTRLRAFLLGGLMVSLGAHASAAGWNRPVETSPGSGVRIELASPLTELPPAGFQSCWISIHNASGAARSWDVRLSMFGSNGNAAVASQSVRVENGASVRLPLLAPLPPGDASYYRRCNVTVDGYGIAEHSVMMPAGGGSRSGTLTGYIAMGETLATPLWEPLKKALKDLSVDLDGSPLEVAQLAPDWRGLSGFDALWLTEAEYTGLEPGRRFAIRRWINQGGVFYLWTQGLDPALRASLGLAQGREEARVGSGSVKLVSWDGTAVKVEDAVPLAQAVRPLHHLASEGEATRWRMTQLVGAIPLNAPFLIVFIFAFAVVAGPVNLFWLADASRRHRLFWTTPLISVAASLLLVAFIALQDGFGGHGARLMVTRLFPAEKEAAITQEQVARTGVLLSRRFTVPDDLVLAEVKVRRMEGQRFEQAGRDYGGDWFASRAVQAQRLRAIVPSRAEVQLLNAEAARGGAAPEVISSIPATLTDLQYLDEEARCWRGAGLRPGERVTLKRGERLEPAADLEGSFQLAALQTGPLKEPGSFYAVAADAPFLPTLPSIRWNRQRAVYLGPVTHP